MVRQADGSSRATLGKVEAPLALGDMEEPTLFSVFDVDCDADVILGYDWLRAHDLTFLYDENQVCFCAERGCLSCRVGGSVPISSFQGLPPRMPRRYFAATSCFSFLAPQACPLQTRSMAPRAGVGPCPASWQPPQHPWLLPLRRPGPPTTAQAS